MNSKELLEKELESPITKARGGVYLDIKTIKQIKQDLDILEELEKEDFKLRIKLNAKEESYIMLKKDIKDLKKVIEILQTNFFIDLIEREKDYKLGFAPKDPIKEQPRFCKLNTKTGHFLKEFFLWINAKKH